MNSTDPVANPSEAKAAVSPELELLVRARVNSRLTIWGIAIGTFLFVVLGVVIGVVAYVIVGLRSLKAKAVLIEQPVMIYNPAWDNTIDAVDPARFPGPHRDDARKGTVIQQWPLHGGPQQIWELRHPSGPRYQSNAPVAVP
jgi:hypothetical protein